MDHKSSAQGEIPMRLEKISVPTFTHEAGGEHTLPDYMPPIRRMVALRASVLPEGTFLSPGASGTSLEVAGTVAYSLIYTDDEGKLAGVSLTSDYSASTALPSDVSEISVLTAAENSTCRVLAPRKVSLRSRLVSEVSAFRSVSLGETVQGKLTAADEMCVERLPLEYRSAKRLQGVCKGLRTEGVLATVHDPIRPVYCDGHVTVKSARAVGDGVILKGTVAVSCLASHEGVAEKPVQFEREEEFEERLEVPGCGEGDLSVGYGRSVSLVLNTDEGADGSREISYEMVFDLEAAAIRNQTMVATTDLYSTARRMDCTYSTGESLYGERSIMASVTVSETLPYKGSAGAACIDVWARAEVGRKEWKEGKLHLDGVAVFNAVFAGEGGEFFGEEYRVPFRYSCDGVSGDGCAEVRCSCGSQNARVDGDKILLGAEVFFAITVFGRGSVSAVSTVAPGDALEREDRATIRVYYPVSGETLWQIGKRYHKSCRDLAEENGIALEVNAPLAGVKKLIV